MSSRLGYRRVLESRHTVEGDIIVNITPANESKPATTAASSAPSPAAAPKRAKAEAPEPPPPAAKRAKTEDAAAAAPPAASSSSAGAAVPCESVAALLSAVRLDSYADAFMEQGYDDFDFLLSIAADACLLAELARHVGFKPGHKARFECELANQRAAWSRDC